MTQPTIAQLYNLANRAATGLTADEQQRLREGIDRAEDVEQRIKNTLALHQPMQRGPFTICAHCSGWDGKWRCQGVVTDYPCPTVTALTKPKEPTP